MGNVGQRLIVTCSAQLFPASLSLNAAGSIHFSGCRCGFSGWDGTTENGVTEETRDGW